MSGCLKTCPCCGQDNHHSTNYFHHLCHSHFLQDFFAISVFYRSNCTWPGNPIKLNKSIKNAHLQNWFQGGTLLNILKGIAVGCHDQLDPCIYRLENRIPIFLTSNLIHNQNSWAH